jgi:flagellar basal-body rod modification protein FlgD
MTDAISSAAAQAAGSSQASTLGGLGGEAFLQLLVAQLRYQNPMDPSDGTEFLQQTAQFTQVETLQTLADTQAQLMNLTQFSLAVGLSGKTVDAIGADGGRITGEVAGVRFTADGPELEVDTQWIPISNVLEVEPG